MTQIQLTTPTSMPQGDPRWGGARPNEAAGSSWRLGTLAGIPVQVHPTFALLLAWVAITHVGGGVSGILGGLALTLGVFGCVVLHELSHALVARRFGIRTRHITLLPIGGVARLERMPERPRQELAVAIIGPLASLGIAGALFAVQSLLRAPIGLEGLRAVAGPFVNQLMWVNVALAAFNLLPAFPMDGGRVFRAALATQLGPERATELAARVGQALAVLFGALGLFFNPLLVLIAVFVWMGAKAEASLSEVRSLLHGLPIQQAMITQFRVLEPRDPLARAAELALVGFQQDFPVMEEGRLLGVLTRSNLVSGLKEGGAALPAATVMERQFETASPWETLDAAFERLQQCQCGVLVVVDDGRVVGLVTPENIGQLLTLEKARRASRSASPNRS